MSFARAPRRGPISTGPYRAVLAVGRRVSVMVTEGYSTRVALMDDGGNVSVGSVVAGAEVEIVGWRPSGSRGVRYQVRTTGDGLEGWVTAASLRDPVAAVTPPFLASERPVETASVDTGRRFGQR